MDSQDNQAVDSVAQPVTTEPPQQPPTKQPRFSKKRKMIFVGILVVVILLGIGAYFLLNKSTTSKTARSQSSEKSMVVTEKICFLRVGYLNCVDDKGESKVRYDLPDLGAGVDIQTLVSSTDGSQYLASSVTSVYPAKYSLWLIDSKLENAEEIKNIPLDGNTFGLAPTFSHDGKSILLSFNSEEDSEPKLFRYTISSKKLERIGTIYGRNPVETKDGRILYTGRQSVDYRPSVVDANGENNEVLDSFATGSVVDGVFYFSYDYNSDSIYAGTYIKSTGSEKAEYKNVVQTLSKAESGDKLTYLQGDIAKAGGSSGDIVTIMNAKILVLHTGNTILLFNKKDGHLIKTIDKTGTFVGLFTKKQIAQLKVSKQQTEQVEETIGGYDSAPPELQELAKNLLKELQTGGSGSCGTEEAYVGIGEVLENRFVWISSGCENAGGSSLYVKDNGVWIATAIEKNSQDCSDVDKYKIPKSIVAVCYVGNVERENTY